MKHLSKILSNEKLSLEELIICFEQIKSAGNVVVIKLDGERESNQYTVFISFPAIKKSPMIRVDSSTLHDALLQVLKAYVKGMDSVSG